MASYDIFHGREWSRHFRRKHDRKGVCCGAYDYFKFRTHKWVLGHDDKTHYLTVVFPPVGVAK